jgi:aarF domain-containing kinase
VSARLRDVLDLAREAAGLAVDAGPAGALRGVQVAAAAAGLAGEAARAAARGAPLTPARALRRLFERLGATYVKLGQFIASAPSVFPPDFVTEFEGLLDATEPVPWSAVKRTLEAELGGRAGVEAAFSFIDETPLASASVAQVHAAVLRESGTPVVVKVLKPGVEGVLTADLSALYVGARALELAAPGLARASASAILADIRAAMLDEVDFRKEALHIADFRAYLEGTGMDAVATCPAVFKPFSTRRVLTMTRLDGVPLTDVGVIGATVPAAAVLPGMSAADAAAASGGVGEAMLTNALNVWFGSLLAARTFHADVHAGNLLALPDGRVAFIDFGIVGRVTPGTWEGVRALVGATATGDYETMARALATVGAAGGGAEAGGDPDAIDFAAFASDLEAAFTAAAELEPSVVLTPGPGGPGAPPAAATLTLDEARLNRLALAVVRVGEGYGVRVPRQFGVLLKQLLYFDRYARVLAPGLDLAGDGVAGLGSVEARFAGFGSGSGGGGGAGMASDGVVDV